MSERTNLATALSELDLGLRVEYERNRVTWFTVKEFSEPNKDVVISIYETDDISELIAWIEGFKAGRRAARKQAAREQAEAEG